jgi:hypothetical protein
VRRGVEQVGIEDLLQIVQAVQGNVGLQQATVGYLPPEHTELEMLLGPVELKEVVLVKLPARRVVGPPDDVETLACPRPNEPSERAQRIRRLRGERSRLFVRGGRSRFFYWRQRPENKFCSRFHDPPLNELNLNSDSARQQAGASGRQLINLGRPCSSHSGNGRMPGSGWP